MSTFYTEPTSGTRIATDVVGSDRYQILKLDGGATGASMPLTGTTQYGLLADVSRIQGSVTTSGIVQGPIDDGGTAAGYPVQVGGTDEAGLIRTLLTDVLGVISVRDDRVRKLLEALVVAQFSKEEGEIPGSWEVLLKNDLKTVAFGDLPSPMSAYSRVEPISNVHGIPFNLGGHPDLMTFRVNYTTSQTDAAIITPNANQKVIITSVMVTLDKTTSVTVSVRIGHGTTTTPAGQGVVAAHPGIDPGGGFVKGDGGSVIGVGSLGDPLRITSSVPTGGSIDVVINYFLIEA